jgi:hypothetical protein
MFSDKAAGYELGFTLQKEMQTKMLLVRSVKYC